MKKCFLLLMALFFFVPMAAAQTAFTNSGTVAASDPSYYEFNFAGKIAGTDTLFTNSFPGLKVYRKPYEFVRTHVQANDSVKIVYTQQAYYNHLGTWQSLFTFSTDSVVFNKNTDTLDYYPDSLRIRAHGITGNGYNNVFKALQRFQK